MNPAGLSQRQWQCLLLAWLVALASTLGALFFSEVMQFEPCVLCWYQRIAMFPLVFVLGASAYTDDAGGVKYALPLALAGWAAALYHMPFIRRLYFHRPAALRKRAVLC